MGNDDRTEEERARVYAMLYARLHAPPLPPLEAAAKFLRSHFLDDTWEEAEERLTRLIAQNPRSVLAGLAGIESLLADPAVRQIDLYNLVAWVAGRDEIAYEGAAAWLREVAEMVRKTLGDKQPPR